MDNPIFVPNLDAVQFSKHKYVELTLQNFIDRGNVIDLEVEVNAEITGGAINVTDTFNTTGTDTLSVGDSASATRYLGATNLKAAARTPLVPTGYVTLPTTNKVRLTRTPADGAATKGTVRVWFAYIRLGASEYTQG